ncbi:MAG: N-formylglutamate amidohydrolase, partial [Pseudomonadota bacterium]
TVGEVLSDLGYTVVNNIPYAGGYTTRHYGQPAQSVHALQIEINRALYMDEERIERRPGITRLAKDMGTVMSALSDLTARSLR